MTITAALVVFRWLHFGCLTVWFGVAAFPLYALRDTPEPAAWALNRRRLGRIALWGAFASGIGWFLFSAAAMSGDPSGLWDLNVQKTVLFDTPFGPLWALRLSLIPLSLAFLAQTDGRVGRLSAVILSGLLLASLALTGHARADEGTAGVLHAASDALHLLMAGAWIGGLFALAFVTRLDGRPGEPDLQEVLSSFSGMAYSAVALLVLTGVMNSVFMLASPGALLTTGYGRLLSVKLALFVAMLALAAVNRFWISPALTRGGAHREDWLRRLKRHILGEQILAAVVLAVVAMLGAMDPAS